SRPTLSERTLAATTSHGWERTMSSSRCGYARSFVSLRRSHRGRRIDPRGAQRWNPTRYDADQSHGCRNADERRRIVWRDAEQQTAHDAASDVRAADAEREAEYQQRAALAEDHSLHAAAVCAEAHADADFVRAGAHGKRQHAGDAHGGNDHR